MSNWKPRPIVESEVDTYRRRIGEAFGSDFNDDDAARDRFNAVFDLDRTFAVFDDEEMIGTGAAFTFDVSIPGGTTPMGGTTVITVRPTHTRRGVLNAMMDYHLDEVASRGEYIAGLWASEGSIYGRFGYGMASRSIDAKINAKAVSLHEVGDGWSVSLHDESDAKELIKDIYNRALQSTAGLFTKSDGWWDNRVFGPDEPSGGYSKKRYVIAYGPNGAEGYAIYRQKSDWSAPSPAGEVKIAELVSVSGSARHALWRYLLGIDLFSNVTWWNMPVDDSLSAMLRDPRQLAGPTDDGLWIRLLDIPAALSARTYQTDGEVRISVTDGFRPSNDGTYKLSVTDGMASCEPTEDDPDVSCDVDVLGHLYLGGGSAMAMSDAGRIVGEGEAIRLLHRMFLTDRAPWCSEVF